MSAAALPADPGASVGEMLARAFAAHKAGRTDAAADLYAAVLDRDPDNFHALHLLGEIAQRTGRAAQAVELIARALAVNPASPEAHTNLGAAHQTLGNADAAEASYRRALSLDPFLSTARNNLGVLLKDRGRRAEAQAELEKALALAPGSADARLNLGNLLREAGDFAAAEAHYRAIIAARADHAGAWNNLGITLLATGRSEAAHAALARAAALNPASAETWNNLGNACRALRRMDEALGHYTRAQTLRPDFAQAPNNAGVVLFTAARYAEALAMFERALAIDPGFADAHANRGACLRSLERLSEAVGALDRAIALEPGSATAFNTRGLCRLELGLIEEGLDDFQAATRLKPDFARARSNYLFGLNYRPDMSGEALLAEHRRYDPAALRSAAAFPNAPDPERRLRIGYVSPDFKRHSCAFFLEPLLAAHDPAAVEVVCYSDVALPDAVTARFCGYAQSWRDVSGMSDGALAETIRADGIDIAVDLAGHTGNNRLPAFAARVAPVQVTWLGYPCTTGLAAMDYRIGDPVSDPVGQAEAHFSERLLRLPRTFLAYRPPPEAPPPGGMPALAGHPFTFGSFNNLPKINDGVIAVWAEILRRAPGARLVLKSRALADAPTARRMQAAFAAQGIAPGRVELIGWITNPADHLTLYGRIDLALDPFPYNGTTTTCEALWMGVPVLTLAGARHAGRVGASLLSQVDLGAFVAGSVEAYIGRAAELAHAPERIAPLRGGLRQRMAASPLCDAAAFARDMEAAYRSAWRAWCAGGPLP